MPRNTSVSLGDHFAGFIDQKVKEGRYGSASDVIRAGLRLLEEEEAKLAHLRDLIAEGEASGPRRAWDWPARRAEWMADARKRDAS
ncbi:type II toxin-antitoxin system ParD family antitoxin [Rhodobacteraceae bacterium W635]|uniref:type II toxin-antitoxin system ParD family antitoxin n=1 Tax=Nioella halotolerans TaxID=2303578 RepID=UPI000E3DE6B1|nr:type II toxin-antitoxin system ParD family antitoxin [Rhodobacteraceae bacterium W635]